MLFTILLYLHSIFEMKNFRNGKQTNGCQWLATGRDRGMTDVRVIIKGQREELFSILTVVADTWTY